MRPMPPLVLAILPALPIPAQAEIKVGVNMSLTNLSVTISGATEEDVLGDEYQKFLEEAGKKIRNAYLCGMMKQSVYCIEYQPPEPKEIPLCREDQQNEFWFVCRQPED